MALFLQLAMGFGVSGKVVSVKDGDTIEILHGGRLEKVRLECIDAPEIGQPFGKQAKYTLGALVFGQEIRVRVLGQDRYGRTLGEVFLPDGSSVNRQMVARGMAWNYEKYCTDPVYARLESEARKAGLGLWRERNPEPPWEFRSRKRKARKWF